MVSKGQIVSSGWNRIARLHSHVLAHMNSLTASRCHTKASHMNLLTASHRHIKAYRNIFSNISEGTAFLLQGVIKLYCVISLANRLLFYL